MSISETTTPTQAPPRPFRVEIDFERPDQMTFASVVMRDDGAVDCFGTLTKRETQFVAVVAKLSEDFCRAVKSVERRKQDGTKLRLADRERIKR